MSRGRGASRTSPPGRGDGKSSSAHVRNLIPTKVEVTKQMAFQDYYTADTTNLPSSFVEATFVAQVNTAISAVGIPDAAEPILRCGIIGMLLLDGNSDPTSPSFGGQIRNRLWTYVQSPLVDSNGVQIQSYTNKDAFEQIDLSIRRIRPPSVASPNQAYYQELATAARQIIDGQRGAIVYNNILLDSAVRVALQNYGSGTSTQGSFELPPLTGPTTGGGTDEIIPDHIRSVGMHVAAYQLEVVGLWQALHR